MLRRDITLDTNVLSDKHMDYYVQMTRAMSLFNLCINKSTLLKNSHALSSKRGRTLHITTRQFLFFENSDPDYQSCSVEILATENVRFFHLDLLGHKFELAEFYRPSHNISPKDYEFIIAATVLPTYARPYTDVIKDKRLIMGEIHDFIEDYT